MLPDQHAALQNPVKPSRHTQYGAGSLIVAGLAITIVLGGIYLLANLGRQESIPSAAAYHAGEALVVGGSLLPVIGIALGLVGGMRRSGSKAAPVIGLIANSGLFLAAFVLLLYPFYLRSPAIHGSLTINGEPPTEAEVFVQEACVYPQVFSQPETWCSDSATVAFIGMPGQFVFSGLEPGDYSFHAVLEIPSSVSCVSVSPEFVVTTSDIWNRDATLVDIRARNALSVPFGFWHRLRIDGEFVCR